MSVGFSSIHKIESVSNFRESLPYGHLLCLLLIAITGCGTDLDGTTPSAEKTNLVLKRDKKVVGADTPDPEGGIVRRDPVTGEASGILVDNAAYLYRKQLPAYTQDQTIEALTWSINELVQFGITSFKEAIVTEDTLKAYHGIDKIGALKARAKTSLTWKSEWADSHQQETRLIANRDNYNSEMLDTGFAKIMLDGVPPSYTAALLEPYLPSQQYGSNYRGFMMLEYGELIKDVVELDRQGSL